jgi:hypothetical protein
MKIISWNLKNIGATKLGNAMNPAVALAGYGNTVGDFILNVVMANALWNGVNTAFPVDIFLIIELKCGGHNKSTVAAGTCTPTLTALVNAMNVVAAGLAPALNYHYTAVAPLVVGYHECVGVIYNDQALTHNASVVLRDNNLRYINPRSPFLANFTVGGGPAQLNVVGIHAPPPGGAAAIRFSKPIGFCNRLPQIPTLMLAPPNQFVIGGDFNCEQANTWTVGGYARHPFFNPSVFAPPNTDLVGYATNLPAGTLTSVRNKVDNSQVGPARYLNGAYDNILYQTGAPPIGEYAIDLIGNLVAGVGLVAKLNNYLRVSDHMPVAVV